MKVTSYAVTASETSELIGKLANSIDHILSNLGKWLSSDDCSKILNAKQDDSIIFELLLEVNEESESGEATMHEEILRLLLKVTGGSDDYRIYDLYLKRKDAPDNTAKVKKGVKIELPDSNMSAKKFAAYLLEKVTQYVSPMIKQITDDATDSWSECKLVSVTSSQHLKVTLKKISADSEVSVNLVNVMSSYSIEDTCCAIDTIAQNDDFVTQLPENEPCTYAISISEDGYDVDVCESNLPTKDTCSDSIHHMLLALHDLGMTNEFIRSNATGLQAEELSRYCESLGWIVSGQIDRLNQLSVRINHYAPHPVSIIQALEGCWNNRHFTYEEGINEIRNKISNVLTAFDLYWCNFEAEDQLMIKSFHSEWDHQRNYVIARQVDFS